MSHAAFLNVDTGRAQPVGGAIRTGDRHRQPSLAVAPRTHPLEQEANRVADEIMAAPARPAVGPAKPRIGASVTAPDGPHALATAAGAESRLSGAGEPLDAMLRDDMEQRFGHDFASVRVHTGAAAAQMARSVKAKAFVACSNVVFGAGRYDPHSSPGRRLLAHELVHVIQQRSSPTPGPILRDGEDALPESDAEGEESYADRWIQARIEEASIEVARGLHRSMAMSMSIAIPESIMAALIAAEVSFLYRSYQLLVEEGHAAQILGRIEELLTPATALEFFTGYVWGVLQGLVSPITGLWHLAEGGIQFAISAVEWIHTLPEQAPELLAEAEALRQSMQEFGSQASATLTSLRDRDQLLAFAGAIIAAVPAGAEAFQRQLVRGAQRQGRRAATSLVRHFLNTPLRQLGVELGEIVGTVFIELVLLLFTTGVGNLITKLGELARRLAPRSRGVRAFTGVALWLARWITVVEDRIGALLSRTVLRPLMPLFRALEPLLVRTRQFADRLLLAGERGAVTAAGRTASHAGTTSESALGGERSIASAQAGAEPTPAVHEPGAVSSAPAHTSAAESTPISPQSLATPVTEPVSETAARARAAVSVSFEPPTSPGARGVIRRRPASRSSAAESAGTPPQSAATPVTDPASVTAAHARPDSRGIIRQAAVSQRAGGAARGAASPAHTGPPDVVLDTPLRPPPEVDPRARYRSRSAEPATYSATERGGSMARASHPDVSTVRRPRRADTPAPLYRRTVIDPAARLRTPLSEPAPYSATEQNFERLSVAQPEVTRVGRPSQPRRAPTAREQESLELGRELRDQAVDRWDALDLQEKTVAVGESGAVSISGGTASTSGIGPETVAARAQAADVLIPTHPRDFSGPGSYHAGHAEPKIAEPHTGVSREMCDVCIRLFRGESRRLQRPLLVSDPVSDRVFEPDGRYTEYWGDGTIVTYHPNGSVTSQPSTVPIR